MKNNLNDKLFYLLMLLIGLYWLYIKGYILRNFEVVEPKVAYEMLGKDNNITLLDVRTPQEFQHDGKITGAKLIPLSLLPKSLDQLDRSKKILVYCRSGNRSVAAARILVGEGFRTMNLSGGILAWKKVGLPLE